MEPHDDDWWAGNDAPAAHRLPDDDSTEATNIRDDEDAAAIEPHREIHAKARPKQAVDAKPEPGAILKPGIDYLIELMPNGQFRPWPLNRPYHSVGRRQAKIVLEDRRVSRRHLAVAKAGAHWLVVNTGDDKRLWVGGWSLRQKVLRAGDVIRIGDTWLVFAASGNGAATGSLRRMTGSAAAKKPSSHLGDTLGTLEEVGEAAHLTLLAGTRSLADSEGEPVLIGSHPKCTARLEGPDIAPIHCVLSWTDEGVTLFELGGTVRIDGIPVRLKCPVGNRQLLTIGEQTLSIRLIGDPKQPGYQRQQRFRCTPRALALTCIYGPHSGESALLPTDQPLVLGRGADADLVLGNDPKISRRQFAIMLDGASSRDHDRRPVVHIRDHGRKNATLINREPVEGEGIATVGDIIQFGNVDAVAPTALLLHLDLALDAWPAGRNS